MPEALVKYVLIKSYVDANHAGNMANRRLHSGIIIYVNNAPIIWYSKIQNTVEVSSFGSGINRYYPGEPVNIHIQSLINIIQENNWVITTKKG